MAYQKTVWATDDDITSEKLNKIENELEALDNGDGDEGGSGGVEPVFILLDTSEGDLAPVGWSDANYDTKAAAVVSAAMAGSPVFFKIGEYDLSEETIPDANVTDIIPISLRYDGEHWAFDGALSFFDMDGFLCHGYTLQMYGRWSKTMTIGYIDGSLASGAGGEGEPGSDS